MVAAADALGARRSLAGITVAMPEVARLSKDREGKLELRIRNERRQTKILRLALALPREIKSAQEDLRVQLPAGGEWSQLAWPCLPLKRGRYLLNAVHVESSSPYPSTRKFASIPI